MSPRAFAFAAGLGLVAVGMLGFVPAAVVDGSGVAEPGIPS